MARRNFAVLCERRNCGIARKSESHALFTLTRTSKAQAANYPFCYDDRRPGVVRCPDSRSGDAHLNMSKSVSTGARRVSNCRHRGLSQAQARAEGLENRFQSYSRGGRVVQGSLFREMLTFIM